MANPNDYVTVTQIKAELADSSGDWGSRYDSMLPTLAERVSRYIDQLLNRPAGAFSMELSGTKTTKVYRGGGSFINFRFEWLEITTVKYRQIMGGGLTEITAGTHFYYLNHDAQVISTPSSGEPCVGIQLFTDQTPIPSLPDALEVNGYPGYFIRDTAEVYLPVEQAALALCLRWWKRGQGAWADAAGAIADMGTMHFTKAMDPEIRAMLDTVPKILR